MIRSAVCLFVVRLTTCALVSMASLSADAEERGQQGGSEAAGSGEPYLEGTEPWAEDAEPPPPASESETDDSSSGRSRRPRREGQPLSGWRPYLIFGGLTGFDVAFANALDDAAEAAGETDWVNVDVAPQVGLTTRVGLRHDLVAVEALVDAIPHFEAKQDGRTLLDYSQVAIGGNLRLYPLDGTIQPNIIAGGGYGFLVIDPERGDRAWFGGGFLRGGAGVDVVLTQTLALSIDATYVWTTGDIRDSDYVTLGWGLLAVF